MNRTIKDATVKVYHYDDLESLKAHVLAFIAAYDLAKHLKVLRWRAPYQVVCEAWTKDPSILKINPHHPHPGTTHLSSQTFAGASSDWRRGQLAAQPIIVGSITSAQWICQGGHEGRRAAGRRARLGWLHKHRGRLNDQWHAF